MCVIFPSKLKHSKKARNMKKLISLFLVLLLSLSVCLAEPAVEIDP